MNMFSTFEILPDEIILNVCQYLRGGEVLYSFYNLNTRINITITGYCRYVNLMSVVWKQFHYVATDVLPCIGFHVRSFVLNANWETLISTQLSTDLFTSRLSFLCPQLEKLTLQWFTTEMFQLFIHRLENFPQLNNLNIRCLTGENTDELLEKVFSANNCRLTIVSFDQDSINLDISEDSTEIFYPNIEELTVNITLVEVLPRLFKLVPNVRRLYVTIDQRVDNSKSEEIFPNLPLLVHLSDFHLCTTTGFWTFDEITDVLQRMPSLQKLVLDLHTIDERFLIEENLSKILPSTSIEIDYFIHYHCSELNHQNEDSLRLSTACLLDEISNRLLIYTIPCGLRSVVLPASIGKQMSAGWKYTQQVEDLYIYDTRSLLELLLVLQHFRRIRTLTINVFDCSEMLTLPPSTQPIVVKLPCLKQLYIDGICELTLLLNASANLVKLNVEFNCLKVLLENDSTHYLLQTGIQRLIITDSIDMKSDLIQRITQIFGSLCHMDIYMEDSTLIIDSFLLSVLSLWKDKPRISLGIDGLLSEEVTRNIRQWIIDHSYLTAEHSFVVKYHNNFFRLWL